MYKVDAKVQKASPAEMAGGGSVDDPIAGTKSQILGSANAEVRLTDSECQVPSITRLPHTKMEMKYGQYELLVIPNAWNAPALAYTQQMTH